ncbi:MAG: hypothetical protein ACRCXT_04530 [Paraclostridium sp.]
MEIRKYESIPNIYKVSDRFLKVGDLIHVSEKMKMEKYTTIQEILNWKMIMV